MAKADSAEKGKGKEEGSAEEGAGEKSEHKKQDGIQNIPTTFKQTRRSLLVVSFRYLPNKFLPLREFR